MSYGWFIDLLVLSMREWKIPCNWNEITELWMGEVLYHIWMWIATISHLFFPLYYQYILKDSAKNARRKDKSTFTVVAKREDQPASSSGKETSASETSMGTFNFHSKSLIINAFLLFYLFWKIKIIHYVVSLDHVLVLDCLRFNGCSYVAKAQIF